MQKITIKTSKIVLLCCVSLVILISLTHAEQYDSEIIIFIAKINGSNITLLTLEDFAKDIATDPKNARDSWLIEMVGGPTIDENCDTYNCPSYTFSDLKTYYWHTLIAGVEKYSNQNKLDYVGFSNGCRVALDSLKNYSVTGKNNAGYYFDSVTG